MSQKKPWLMESGVIIGDFWILDTDNMNFQAIVCRPGIGKKIHFSSPYDKLKLKQVLTLFNIEPTSAALKQDVFHLIDELVWLLISRNNGNRGTEKNQRCEQIKDLMLKMQKKRCK